MSLARSGSKASICCWPKIKGVYFLKNELPRFITIYLSVLVELDSESRFENSSDCETIKSIF